MKLFFMISKIFNLKLNLIKNVTQLMVHENATRSLGCTKCQLK